MRLFLSFFPVFLFALNLSVLLTHPKSYVRDFYLTQFMKETNSTVLAYKAYSSMYKQKPLKHLRILASKSPVFLNIYKCVNVKPSYLKDVDIACIQNNGLYLKTIAQLKKSDLEYLYDNLPDGKIKSAVYAFLYNDFSGVFKNRDLGYYFIINYHEKKIDQDIKNLKPFEDRYFNLFVKYAVVYNLPKIEKSLLRLNYNGFDKNVKWWLFLDAMKNKKFLLAKKILYTINSDSSKILFWKWRLGDKNAYKKLLSKTRINIYTLYAYEKAHKKFFIKHNIIYNSVKKPEFNQTDPWDVLKFFDKLKTSENLFALAKKLDSNKSIALKALVLDKAFHYKYNIFITPDMYSDKNITFKSFVYAIARQESRFIPASVSRSYALGTMQLMPFLVKSMKGDIFKQFNYRQNVKLGVKHLKWLFSKLHNPLMVAYAYNGGIGFVNRKVKPYFSFKGRYEPFLSMELVPYDESREYGKKVITNYVIYNHIFGNKEMTLDAVFKK